MTIQSKKIDKKRRQTELNYTCYEQKINNIDDMYNVDIITLAF